MFFYGNMTTTTLFRSMKQACLEHPLHVEHSLRWVALQVMRRKHTCRGPPGEQRVERERVRRNMSRNDFDGTWERVRCSRADKSKG